LSGEPDEAEQRKREDRRAWLGDPIEHGGGYRPSKAPVYGIDAGCCLVELLGVFSVFAGIVALSFSRLLS